LNQKSIPFSPRIETGPADHEGLREKGDSVKGHPKSG